MTPALKQMLIDGFIPPWQDKEVLAICTSNSPDTIDNWQAQGILPPPRKRGGKLMWKWAEVDAWLTGGRPISETDLATKIAEGVRRERAKDSEPYVSIFDGPNPPRRR
jgi:predicted DNA-binding transcriptional regulator AlpA